MRMRRIKFVTGFGHLRAWSQPWTVHFRDASGILLECFQDNCQENPQAEIWLTGRSTQSFASGFSSGNLPGIIPESSGTRICLMPCLGD